MEETKIINSKKVGIDIGLDFIFQISYTDRNIVEILEKLIIDLVLLKLDRFGDVYNSFSLVLEKLNKELKTLSKDYNFEKLNIFLWVIQKDTIHFSILWNYSIYLIKNNKIVDIADWMQSKNLEFSYISSGNILWNDMVFFSNLNLLDYITKDDIFEIVKTQKVDKLEIIEQILAQEAVNEQYHIISVTLPTDSKEEINSLNFDLIKSKFLSIKDRIEENEKVVSLISKIKNKIDFKNKYIYLSFLGLWITISVILLYFIIWAILNNQIEKTVPEQYKNKLIEAKLILERTNKDIGNSDVFDANIKKAENLIFEVRWKNVFMSDVEKLLSLISALKKQKNWIETFNFTQDKAQIIFKEKDFGINWIFELNKKYYYIWTKSLIGPYIKWEEPKAYPYPDWEEVVSADVTPDWFIFLLTKSARLIQFYKQNFKYVNVEWQTKWENSVNIKSYNWNIYLLSEKRNQILRHKPWINWFSSKQSLIDEKEESKINIQDFWIDWGFYLLKWDLTLDKFFTTPTFNKRSIVINWVKNNSYERKTDKTAKLFVWQNLNYLYMLIDNRIWIFEADSRNYKDVKSIKYLWQLEPGEKQVNTIFIPKDGEILIWNTEWVYKINFEVSDGKIIIR